MTPVRTRRTQAIANRSGGGKYTESLELRQMLSAVVPIGVNGKTFDRTPTITWSADAGAVSYEIWVSQLGENQSAVLVKSGIVSTSYTVAPADLGALQQLNAQTHRVWVRSYPAAGAPSAWSAPVDFTVTTDRPLVTAPLSSGVNTLIETPSPVLSWTSVSGASLYSVQVDNLTTGAAGVFVDILHAVRNEAGSNVWKLWVMSV